MNTNIKGSKWVSSKGDVISFNSSNFKVSLWSHNTNFINRGTFEGDFEEGNVKFDMGGRLIDFNNHDGDRLPQEVVDIINQLDFIVQEY